MSAGRCSDGTVVAKCRLLALELPLCSTLGIHTLVSCWTGDSEGRSQPNNATTRSRAVSVTDTTRDRKSMPRFGALFWGRSAGSLLGRGNQAELLHHAQHIDLAPALHDLIVHNPLDPDSAHRDAFAGWRYTLKLARVHGRRGHPADYLVALS